MQQAVDSDELKQKEKESLESMPARMKNQGRRRVDIQTTRGEPVTIEAPLFLTIALKAVDNHATIEHIQFWTIGESHRGSKEDPDSRFD